MFDSVIDIESTTKIISSDVPQGSGLGAVLFLIYTVVLSPFCEKLKYYQVVNSEVTL